MCSICVKKQFCYVSPNATFLCGYSVEEALKSGYEFYTKIIYKDDLPYLIKIHKAILMYLGKVEERWREIDYFYHVMRFKQKYSFLATPLLQMMYHRVKPVMIDNKAAYLICAVGNSVINETINPCVYYKKQIVIRQI